MAEPGLSMRIAVRDALLVLGCSLSVACTASDRAEKPEDGVAQQTAAGSVAAPGTDGAASEIEGIESRGVQNPDRPILPPKDRFTPLPSSPPSGPQLTPVTPPPPPPPPFHRSSSSRSSYRNDSPCRSPARAGRSAGSVVAGLGRSMNPSNIFATSGLPNAAIAGFHASNNSPTR